MSRAARLMGLKESVKESFSADLAKAITALNTATEAVADSLSHDTGDGEVSVSPADIKSINKIKDLIDGLKGMVDKGLDDYK